MVGLVQGFVSKASPDTYRYPWAPGYDDNGTGETLSDIALRFDVVVCNEAVSKRTNAAIKRGLSLFRLRMRRDVLLLF
jgi:hypothetical protein